MLTINVDSANVTCTTASVPRQVLTTTLFTMHSQWFALGSYGSCEDKFL